MRMLLLSYIALLFSMPLVVSSEATTDVTNFLKWLSINAQKKCTSTEDSSDLINDCKGVTHDAVGDGPKPSEDGAWTDMCYAAGETITCANLPSATGTQDPQGTDLYKNFTNCCTQCAVDNPSTDNAPQARGCCAACPSPIDFLLFWAEHKAQKGCEDTNLVTNCNGAALGAADTFPGKSLNAKYKPMCEKLNENVGCDHLKEEEIEKPPFTDFKDCCKICNGSSYKTADAQMDCVKDKNCGAPPTTHITGQTTKKQTTAGPAPPGPPAPTTTTTVIPKTTTETEGEDSDGNGTGPTDTSAPFLPPAAIWAKVIALTALIAKLL